MHSILLHEEVWGGYSGGRGPASALTSKIYRKSIENPLLINVSMHHSSFAGYKFRADSEQASFYASSNRMMSRGRLKIIRTYVGGNMHN